MTNSNIPDPDISKFIKGLPKIALRPKQIYQYTREELEAELKKREIEIPSPAYIVEHEKQLREAIEYAEQLARNNAELLKIVHGYQYKESHPADKPIEALAELMLLARKKGMNLEYTLRPNFSKTPVAFYDLESEARMWLNSLPDAQTEGGKK